MSDKLLLSVFIISYNEADRIMQPILSVREWVDEVIVVDSGSTDNTVKTAESLGARVIHHDWPGYGLQKRFGEDQCKNRWLLNLDADEEVTHALAQEIRMLFSDGEPSLSAYSLRIRDLLPGETRLALMAHTNYAVRLYNRDKARFSDSPVHDTVQLGQGKSALLTHAVLHRSFRNLVHMLDKMNSYTSAQAENMHKRGMSFPLLRLVVEFPLAFFKGYILRGYILRGMRGFIYSMMYAFARFVRIAKYLESKPPLN